MTRPLSSRLMVLFSTLSLGMGGALAQTAAPTPVVGQAGNPDEVSPLEVSFLPADDVIATVGGQDIRFSQLTEELDRGAVVGVSVPGYGTPERKQILMRLLDEAIRAQLLYRDAVDKGVDRDPTYQRELKRFQDSLLASLFLDRQAHGGQQVQNEELRKQWRQGIPITIDEDALDPARDDARPEDEVLATMGEATITWRDARPRLLVATRRAALKSAAMDVKAERLAVLEQLIDFSVMALLGRQAGLERDPLCLRRLSEFENAGLAGFRYRQLAAELAPSEEEIEAYAGQHTEIVEDVDGRSRRAAERTLIEQRVDQYLDGLLTQGIHVRVNEDKFDRLFAQEAERRAAEGEAALNQ